MNRLHTRRTRLAVTASLPPTQTVCQRPLKMKVLAYDRRERTVGAPPHFFRLYTNSPLPYRTFACALATTHTPFLATSAFFFVMLRHSTYTRALRRPSTTTTTPRVVARPFRDALRSRKCSDVCMYFKARQKGGGGGVEGGVWDSEGGDGQGLFRYGALKQPCY
jgi:hypothetical protein